MMMKKLHKTHMVISIFLLTAILAGCSGMVTTVVDEGERVSIGAGSGSGQTITETETVQADEFDSIEVTAEAMAIIVKPIGGDTAEIELVKDKAIDNKISMDVQVTNRKLQLTVKEKSKMTAKSQKGERKLVILLPDQSYEQISITTDFGTVNAADLKAESFDIMVDAGSIEARNLSGKTTLKTSAGDIVVDDFKLEHDLTAKADVGEIRITLDESPEAGTVSLRTSVGEVRSDIDRVEYITNSAFKKEGTFGSGSNGHHLEAVVDVGSIQLDSEK